METKGTVDVTKPVLKLPECGVEGCSNPGWIALRSRFVCGECLVRLNQIEADEVFNKLKKPNYII